MQRTILACVFVFLLQGCRKKDFSSGADVPTIGDCLRYERTHADPHGQGREILGFGHAALSPDPTAPFNELDRFDPTKVTKNGKPVENFSIQRMSLVGSLDGAPLVGAAWKGVVFTGKIRCVNPKFPTKDVDASERISDAVEQDSRITNAGPNSPHAMVWVYKFEWITLIPPSPGGGSHNTSNPLCKDSDDVAFPMPGYWQRDYDPSNPHKTGKYVRDSRLFSFACVKRDAAKCLLGGYSGASPPAGETDFFQECTRMMTADYCGDGRSFTKDGTDIDFWDNAQIATFTPKPDLHFEAAWGPDGARCIDHLRWKLRIPPPCIQNIPHCDSEAGAPKLPSVFNESCVTHPCGDEHHPFPVSAYGLLEEY